MFVNAATACLLLGASGASMAVDCADGTIVGQTVDEIVVDGRSCHVEDVVVQGNVTVTNSEKFALIDSNVGGALRVTGGRNARIILNEIASGSVDVSNNELAAVLANIAPGTMLVNSNAHAEVVRNVVTNLTCTANLRLDSRANEVAGVNNCVTQ